MTDPKLKEKFSQHRAYRGPPTRSFDLPDMHYSQADQEIIASSGVGEVYSQTLYTLSRKSVAGNAILEIGIGNSSLAFANALKDESVKKLISIDVDQTKPDRFLFTAVKDLGISWQVIHGDSLKVPLETLPSVVDLLFIDGDHGGEHAIGDYRRYASLVRKGGLIVFDDYPLFSGPEAAVAMLEKEGVAGSKLTYNNIDGNGFYVIQK